MEANKTARALCGDPEYIDNWVDKVGYSQLVVDAMEPSPVKKPAPEKKPARE